MSIKTNVGKRECHLITTVVELISSNKKVDGQTVYETLSNCGGIDFLVDNFEVEHTLSLSQIIEDTLEVCRKNGGVL